MLLDGWKARKNIEKATQILTSRRGLRGFKKKKKKSFFQKYKIDNNECSAGITWHMH